LEEVTEVFKYQKGVVYNMNLDLAIQNTLRRSPMEGAMHGVMSDFGSTYQLTSYTESSKAAESILGKPVAHMSPNALSRPVHAEKRVVKNAEPTTDLSTVIDGYTLSYSTSSKNWTLSSTGVPGFWDKLLGRSGKSTVLATKYGANSSHRFLSEIESLPQLSSRSKNNIAGFVLENSGRISTETLQTGYTVDTQPLDDALTSSSSNKILEASGSTRQFELGLATEYAGVAKQRNNTFMGDTVIPQPLSQAQIGMVRTPLGDPVGVHIAPPTRHMGSHRTNRSL